MLIRVPTRLCARLIPLCLCAVLTGTVPALSAAASTAHPRPSARGPYSPAVLASVRVRIPSAQPWARVVRPTLSQWYVDPQADRVVVGLTRITGAARAAAGRCSAAPLSW